MKKCPFCAEEIQEEALKCRYCGEFLDNQALPQGSHKHDPKWYFKTSTVVWGFLVTGPLVIPLVWANPYFSLTKKIVLTAVFIFITILLTKLLASSLAALNQYFQVLQGSF